MNTNIITIAPKSPKFLVIGYFTKNTNYQNLANNLTQTLESLGLPYHLEAIEDLGSWEKNTHYKAYFIKQMLESQTKDLLYVDVDALFKQYPKLIDELDCDLAYRTEDFRWRSDEALSGTIFLKNNERVKEFVNRWIQLNEARPAERMKPETWEQKNMQTAHRELGVSYFNLPPEYTCIFDHTKAMFPNIQPVIEHYQESRKLHRRK